MKRTLYVGLAALVFASLSAPAWAQKGGHGRGAGKSTAVSGAPHGKSATHASQARQRSNKGGEVRGLDRAKEVQGMNAKADAERGFTTAPGLDKASGKASQKAGGTGQGASPSSHAKKGKATGHGKGKAQ